MPEQLHIEDTIRIPIKLKGVAFDLTLQHFEYEKSVLVIGEDGFELAIQRREDGKFEPCMPDFRTSAPMEDVDKDAIRSVITELLNAHLAHSSLMEVWADTLKRAIGDRA